MTAIVDALSLPTDDTPVALAAEMYCSALPLAPIPLYGLRPDGTCKCWRGAACGRSAGKHPIGDDWQRRASRNLDNVRDQFRDHAGNIGLYLGSGRYVGIDADGDVGMSTVASWALPPTLQAQSGSGIGAHYIFEFAAHQDPGEVSDRRVAPGVDVKSKGQFAASPSHHKSGGVYRWIAPLPIATLPDEIYARIRQEKRIAPVSRPPSLVPDGNVERLARIYVDRCDPAIEGSDGSKTTFNVARALRGWIVNRGLTESAGWGLFLDYNHRCQPPWTERELEHKWKDASHAEKLPALEDRPQLRSIAGGRASATVELVANDYDRRRSGSPPPPPGGGSGSGPAPDWQSELLWAEQRNGRPKLVSHSDNVVRILQLHPSWAKCVRFDDFRSRIVLERPPWDSYHRPSKELGAWTDEDTTRLNSWLRREFHSSGFNPTRSDVEHGVPVVARTHDFNPVRDYLDRLVWDGVPRLSTWLTTYLGAEDCEYSRLVGAWWLISACARVYDPGCKVDTVPILEGRQGLKKSSALRTLFGSELFNDTPIDIGSKDAYTAIQGCWCVELAELDSLMRAEATKAKAFFSSGKDRFRRAYARHDRDELRQCIFVGTTNGDEYLNDPTGGRRFWPIACHRIDLNALERDRDQLWAEAVSEFRDGRQWYPSDETEHVLLGETQEGRTKSDAWETRIEDYLLRLPESRTGVAELLTGALKLEPKDWTRSAETRVGGLMVHRFRWLKRRVRRPDGRLVWVYERPESAST